MREGGVGDGGAEGRERVGERAREIGWKMGKAWREIDE
jgi:hypothetical protein